jgi:hypothetical protein
LQILRFQAPGSKGCIRRRLFRGWAASLNTPGKCAPDRARVRIGFNASSTALFRAQVLRQLAHFNLWITCAQASVIHKLPCDDDT